MNSECSVLYTAQKRLCLCLKELPAWRLVLGSLAWECSSLLSDIWCWCDLCSKKVFYFWFKKLSFPSEKISILNMHANLFQKYSNNVLQIFRKSSCSNFPLSHDEFPEYQGQKLLKAMFSSESQYPMSFQSPGYFPANLEGKHMLSAPPFVYNSADYWNYYPN